VVQTTGYEFVARSELRSSGVDTKMQNVFAVAPQPITFEQRIRDHQLQDALSLSN
jgi:hypothetical protein